MYTGTPESSHPDTSHDQLEDWVGRVLPILSGIFTAGSPPWREVDLIRHLQTTHGMFEVLNFHDSRALYRVHFLIFHSLYHLKRTLEQQKGLSLEIHTLGIRVVPFLAMTSPLPANLDRMAAYYLDVNQWSLDRDEIDKLLTSVSSRLSSRGELANAFRTLGLELNSGPEAIKKQYRRLSLANHPDRGGDPDQFHEIDTAYRLIKRAYAIQ